MPEEKGLRCNNCGCPDLRVTRTRPHAGERIMRVRICRNCGRQKVTYEASAGAEMPDTALLDNLSPEARETLRVRLFRFLGLTQ